VTPDTVNLRVESMSETMLCISVSEAIRVSASPAARGTTVPVTEGTTLWMVDCRETAICWRAAMTVGPTEVVTSDTTAEPILCQKSP
jgi:hypothetical protein